MCLFFSNTGILSRIEQERKIALPEIYKDFFRRSLCSMPADLAGTDLDNTTGVLTEGANELLMENSVENFLHEKDFVFMMHQGYMFWYFRADGDPDPLVYGYQERQMRPEKIQPLSSFLQSLRALP